MKSWIITGTGEPRDVARLVECAVPRPGPGEISIDTTYAGLNFADVLLVRGAYQDIPAHPFVPGVEIVGTVRECGPGTTWSPGQRVLASPALPHGQSGAMATVTLASAAEAVSLPDELPDALAATLLLNYVTASLALDRRGNLAPGEQVVVLGGAGGVGSAAIQLARASGAQVTAVVGGADRAAFCVGLGAHQVIDHGSTDVASAVMDITGGRGADVVVDPVGGDAFRDACRYVAVEGRILVVGFASGSIGRLETNRALLRSFSVVGVNRDLTRRDSPGVYVDVVDRVVEQAAGGAFTPPVDSILPMEQLLDGWDRLVDRRVMGKIVLDVGNS